MALTGKDVLVTVLAALAAGVSYASVNGVWLPFLANVRIAVIILAVIGITMCATGAKTIYPSGGLWNDLFNVLGFVAVMLIVAGVITGQRTILIALTGLILGMWVVTTVKHAFHW